VGGGPDRGRRRRSGLDVGSRQRPAVLLVVRLADLALGLLARDLPPGPGYLDGDRDPASHERGDHQVRHGGNDEMHYRANDQEGDQYADPDGGKFEPAHPRHPLSTRNCSISRYYPTLARAGRALTQRRASVGSNRPLR
jgi:hypothetical protein